MGRLINSYRFVTGGGGGGAFTFTREGFVTGLAGDSPLNLTYTSSPPEGDLLIAGAMERSGGSSANFTISDNNSGTWNDFWAVDNDTGTDPGPTGSRIATRGWWRKMGAGEANANPTVTMTDGSGNDKRGAILHYSASAAFDWTLAASQFLGQDEFEWDSNTNTPSITGPAGDFLEIAIGIGRTGGTTDPTAAGTSFVQNDDEAFGVSNRAAVIFSILSASQSGGTRTAVLTSDSVGTEGVLGIAAFTDGA